MSLRARLVVALLGLFTIGMAVFGTATYQAFSRSELTRLDEQLLAAVPVVERELLGEARLPIMPRGRLGGAEGPRGRVVVTPGTYAELRDADGTVLASIQAVDDAVQPNLEDLDLTTRGTPTTVPSSDDTGSWRVVLEDGASGAAVVVAVPMTAVEQALGRLLTIELVSGIALLVVLGTGAGLVLRSALRPLEQIADATRAITAGSLERRVPVPSSETEVRQVATALNTMLDDLEAAFRRRDDTEAGLRRFLSDASHELRTPLTSIQGYAELFRLGRDRDDVDVEVVMQRIEHESARMRDLVDNLLVLARLDEQAATDRHPVDLAVVAADACSDAATIDPDRPIDLSAPAPVEVHGDPRHLRRAVGNLVGNALRHTPTGTAVEVSVGREDGVGVVRVRDHGPGLSEEALPHVWERFWQADPSRAGAGSGLGLSIVAAVASEHGGWVDAGNAPDGGALFAFAVPASHPAGTPQRELAVASDIGEGADGG